jgi:hypothetical protein
VAKPKNPGMPGFFISAREGRPRDDTANDMAGSETSGDDGTNDAGDRGTYT